MGSKSLLGMQRPGKAFFFCCMAGSISSASSNDKPANNMKIDIIRAHHLVAVVEMDTTASLYGGKPSPEAMVSNHGNPATVHHPAPITLIVSGGLQCYLWEICEGVLSSKLSMQLCNSVAFGD